MRSDKDLRDYQRRTCNYLYSHDAAFLMLDMGLGKTVTTLTVFNYLKYFEWQITNALVIAPPSVARNTWPDEVEEWEHLSHLSVLPITGTPKQRLKKLRQPADIHTISVYSVTWLCEQIEAGARLPYDWVIIDESSMFKNPSAKRFLALKNRLIGVPRVTLLTGTPAPNGAADLWAQAYLLDHGASLGKNITAFRNTYCSCDTLANGGRTYKVTNPESQDVIMKKIAHMTVSLKSDDYITLPELQHIDVKLSFDDKTRAQYQEFKKEKVLELLDDNKVITVANAAALCIKLRQFVNGFVYDKDQNAKAIHKLKLEALEEIVEAAQDEPILVAYSFQADKAAILEHFKKLKPVCFEGGNKGVDIIKRWNKGHIKMLIMHPASGGHGLNLQFGGHIICYYGLDWGLEYYQQLIKRIHRSGQKAKSVLLYRIMIKGTIDMNILNGLEGKASSQNAMLDYVKDTINEIKNE